MISCYFLCCAFSGRNDCFGSCACVWPHRHRRIVDGDIASGVRPPPFRSLIGSSPRPPNAVSGCNPFVVIWDLRRRHFRHFESARHFFFVFRANTQRAAAIAQTVPHFVSRFPFLRALPNASPPKMRGCAFAVCVHSLSSGVLWSNTYDVSLLLVFCHCVMLSALPLKHVVANHPVGEYFYYY